MPLPPLTRRGLGAAVDDYGVTPSPRAFGRALRDYNIDRPLRALHDVGGAFYDAVLDPALELGKGILGYGEDAPEVAATSPAPQAPQPVQESPAKQAAPVKALPPLVAPKEDSSHLRYRIGDGQWQDYKPGQEAPERLPGVSGGGTVSMMTAPENKDSVTFASQAEDLQKKAALSGLKRSVEDPYWRQRAEAEAEAGKDLAKTGTLLATITEAENAIDMKLVQDLDVLRRDPNYQSAAPADRAAAEQKVRAGAQAEKQRFRESLGLATGQGAGLFRQSMGGELGGL